MAPTLLPGDWAIAVPVRRIRRGDVVVVEHPDRPGYEMVKRVAGVPGDVIGASEPRGSASTRLLARDEFWVEGDHRAGSTDSRDLGPFLRGSLKARLVLIYLPAERRSLIGRAPAMDGLHRD